MAQHWVTKQDPYSIQQQSPTLSPKRGTREALGSAEPHAPLPAALGTC